MKRVDAYALSRRFRMSPLGVGAPADVGGKDVSFDLAWDGHRVLAVLAHKKLRIVSADFREWSDTFPRVARALKTLPADEAVIEGFLCALDENGRPSFDRLKARAPALLAVWDLLHLDGQDLRGLPLAERRARLAALVAGSEIALSTPLEGDIDVLLEVTRTRGVAGVLARPLGPYPSPDDDVGFMAIPCGAEPLSWARSLSPPPTVTNEVKVLFPRDGFTKKDAVRYYEEVAPVLLPLLADRPIVAQRWPDGIDEFTWYQHRIPPRAPDYVRGVWIDGNHRIVLPTTDALVWMVNQAALTIHAWPSRVARLGEPDWMTLDLDPGEQTRWQDVIEIAVAVRSALELLELPSLPKTSGQRGIHVLVPLAPGHTMAEAHEVASQVAMLVARLLPDKVTLEPDRSKRGGRLFLDHVQSFVGKSLASAYSLRAVDGAPVSAPLAWSEVTKSLDPRAFNLRTMRKRLDSHGDLTAMLLGAKTRLAPALAKLRG